MPGILKVPRRAAKLYRELVAGGPDDSDFMDWVDVWALAVNEENAAGGKVVTAPTNGAAGIVPAVLKYYLKFMPQACDDGVGAGGEQRADRKRCGNWHGAQPGPYLRPDRRTGADPVHRTQRDGLDQGHQRGAHGLARRYGKHMVSLDQVIATMHQTGLDMSTRYKETSQGGLAVNVPEC